MANDGTVKIGVGFEADKSSLTRISSQVKKSFSSVSSAANNALKSTFSVLSNSAKSTLDIFTKGTAAVAAGAAGISGYALKVGKEFEASMSNVMATMGITKDTIQDGVNSYELLKDAAAKAGESTIYTASEAAEALNYLALAGYDAQKAVGALPSVLKLAQAGGMELAYASDLVTDSMAALGIEATSDNLTEFGDKLAKTASSANANVSQLGEAILTVGGTAKSLSGGTTELNAALGVLANRGIKGAEGGTALRNIMTSLTSPTKKAREELAALGVEIFDSEGNMRNLNNIFMDFKNATKNLTDEEQKQALRSIFNKYDLASAEALLSGAGEEFETLANKIDNADGAMEQMAKTMTQNLDGQLKSLQSKTEALGITIYDKLNKPSADFLSTINEMVAGLNNALRESGLEGMTTKFGEYFSELVLSGTKKLPDLMQAGTNISLAISKGINAKSSEISRAIVSALQALPSFIKDNISVALDTGGTILDGVIEGMKNDPDAIADTILYLMFAMPEFVLQRLDAVAPVGMEVVTQIISGIAEKSGDIADKLIEIMLKLPDFLAENLGTILSVGTMLIDKIVNGIDENKEILSEKAVEVISMFVDFLIENAPKIGKAARQIVIALADAIGEEFSQIKPFTDLISKLAENFVPLAKHIIPVVAGLKGFSIIKNILSVVVPFITKIKAAGSVLGIFKLALGALGGPVGIAITAIAGLAGVITAVAIAHNDETTAADKAMKKEKDYAEKVQDTAKKFDELKNSAKEAADKEQLHYDKVQNLWEELQKLADASGNVKKADEDRANYIIGELQDATGLEIGMIDGQIQKYDELKQSIQSVIDKKRAESLLSAYSGTYEESLNIKQEQEAAARDALTRRKEYQNAEEQLRQQISDVLRNQDIDFGVDTAINKYLNGEISGELEKSLDAIKVSALGETFDITSAFSNNNDAGIANIKALYVEASNTYAEAQNLLSESADFITNYENAEIAAQEGRYDAVDDFLKYQKQSQFDAEESNKKSEEQQTADYKAELEKRLTDHEQMLSAMRKSSNSYREEELASAQQAIDDLLLMAQAAGVPISSLGNDAVSRVNWLNDRVARDAAIAEMYKNGEVINSDADIKNKMGQLGYNTSSQNNVTYNITNNNTINSEWDLKKAEEAAFQMYRAKRINDAGKGLTGG